MNPRVKSVKPNKDFTLHITFLNNEERIFDCRPYLEIGVFRELKDWAYFSKVFVHTGTVSWPNEQDFCPDTIYLESRLVKAV